MGAACRTPSTDFDASHHSASLTALHAAVGQELPYSVAPPGNSGDGEAGRPAGGAQTHHGRRPLGVEIGRRPGVAYAATVVGEGHSASGHHWLGGPDRVLDEL